MATSRPLVPLLLAATALGTALPSGSDEVPDDVAAWFVNEAVGTVTELELPEEYTTVAVGDPRPEHLWSSDFLAGKATDEPLAPLEQWVAPYSGDGVPAGTVAAWREDGVVTFASADENALLGAALTELAPDAVLVEEPMLGAHFAVVDETVTTLVPGFFEGPSTAPLSSFQPVLADQVAEHIAAAVPEPQPDRWWSPVVWAALGLALVGAVGLVVRAAWRRSSRA